MGDFHKLNVWQKAKDLAVVIYKISSNSSIANDYGLKDQVRRAAVFIAGNIAEGDELDTNKQAIKHFYYAKGSVAELLTHAIICYEIGYIDKETFNHIEAQCNMISSMLMRLIQARR